jgi:hypothetical protein
MTQAATAKAQLTAATAGGEVFDPTTDRRPPGWLRPDRGRAELRAGGAGCAPPDLKRRKLSRRQHGRGEWQAALGRPRDRARRGPRWRRRGGPDRPRVRYAAASSACRRLTPGWVHQQPSNPSDRRPLGAVGPLLKQQPTDDQGVLERRRSGLIGARRADADQTPRSRACERLCTPTPRLTPSLDMFPSGLGKWPFRVDADSGRPSPRTSMRRLVRSAILGPSAESGATERRPRPARPTRRRQPVRVTLRTRGPARRSDRRPAGAGTIENGWARAGRGRP